MSEQLGNTEFKEQVPFLDWEEVIAYSEEILGGGRIIMADEAVALSSPAPLVEELNEEVAPETNVQEANETIEEQSDVDDSESYEETNNIIPIKQARRKRKSGSSKQATVTFKETTSFTCDEPEPITIEEPETQSTPEAESKVAQEYYVFFRPDATDKADTARLIKGPEGIRINLNELSWNSREVYFESIGEDGNRRRHMMLGNVILDMDALENKMLRGAAIDRVAGEVMPIVTIGQELVIPDPNGSEGYNMGRIDNVTVMSKEQNKDLFSNVEVKSLLDKDIKPEDWVYIDNLSPLAEFGDILNKQNINKQQLADVLLKYNGPRTTQEIADAEDKDNDSTPPSETPGRKVRAHLRVVDDKMNRTIDGIVEATITDKKENPDEDDLTDESYNLKTPSASVVALSSLKGFLKNPTSKVRQRISDASLEAGLLSYKALAMAGNLLDEQNAKTKRARVARKAGFTVAKFAYPYYLATAVMGIKPY